MIRNTCGVPHGCILEALFLIPYIKEFNSRIKYLQLVHSADVSTLYAKDYSLSECGQS